MLDVLAALIPPGVMAGVVFAFVVWLFRSQRADKDEEHEPGQDAQSTVPDETND